MRIVPRIKVEPISAKTPKAIALIRSPENMPSGSIGCGICSIYIEIKIDDLNYFCSIQNLNQFDLLKVYSS